MIITKNTLAKPQLALEANSLVIDIETTGFSARYAMIYLMGIVYQQGDTYMAEQWLCQKDSDEYELLFRFNQLLEDQPTLYHYNGDGFDIPFIKKRMALYDMTCNAHHSRDLLKIARPFKKVLGLDNLKLKTIEAYFGYDREDPFTGGDLIDVYKAYQVNQEEELKKTLLLHNFEDLAGLMDLLSQLPFFRLLQSFRDKTCPVLLTHSAIENGIYQARFKVDSNIDATLQIQGFELSLINGIAILDIQVRADTLYYFFPDYRNYHYLVNEDYAVHKSIGQYVAKDHRKQATKETAYVKKESLFLPALKRYELPVALYYRDRKQKEGYVSVEDLVQAGGFEKYLLELLSGI